MEHWRSAFLGQAKICEALGSPFTAKICRVVAANLDQTDENLIVARILNWSGDMSSNGDSVPLRLCGALHDLKRKGDAKLCAAYPPYTVEDGALWEAIRASLGTHYGAINQFIDSPPQTNEVRRSAALISAGHMLAQKYQMPIISLELGASAGLNLAWADYALDTGEGILGPDTPVLTLSPEWRGAFPTGTQPKAVERLGVDLNPLDPQADSDRLFAYIWADQPERLNVTKAAIEHAQPSAVARGDAIDWLQGQLAPRSGHLRLVYHTIAWQYFPLAKRNAGKDIIEKAGKAATNNSPLAWLSMEADTQGPGAALTLRLWPGDHAIALARVDFHGRWLQWQAGTHL